MARKKIPLQNALLRRRQTGAGQNARMRAATVEKELETRKRIAGMRIADVLARRPMVRERAQAKDTARRWVNVLNQLVKIKREMRIRARLERRGGTKIRGYDFSRFLSCPRCWYMEHKLGIKFPNSITIEIDKEVKKILRAHCEKGRSEQKNPLFLENVLDGIGKELSLGKISSQYILVKRIPRYMSFEISEEGRPTIIPIGTGSEYLFDKKSGAIIPFLIKTKNLPSEIVEEIKEVKDVYETTTDKFRKISQGQVYELCLKNFLLRNRGFRTENYGFILEAYTDEIKLTDRVQGYRYKLFKIALEPEDVKRTSRALVERLEDSLPPAPALELVEGKNSRKIRIKCEGCRYVWKLSELEEGMENIPNAIKLQKPSAEKEY